MDKLKSLKISVHAQSLEMKEIKEIKQQQQTKIDYYKRRMIPCS